MNLDNVQILTWIMTTMGFAGFIFAGKKEWWAWYINMACQILWFAYALATGQPAFLVFAVAYFVIFARNAYLWTKDHLDVKKFKDSVSQLQVGGTVIYDGVTITRNPVEAEIGLADDYNVELIARTCHEANRVLQEYNMEEPSLPWHLAPQWQKDSAIEGVHKAFAGETAEELHISWCNFKIADGWTYGPFKDASIKTHPCLVPYSELPEIQRVKDHLFRAIVKSFKVHKQYANVPQG